MNLKHRNMSHGFTIFFLDVGKTNILFLNASHGPQSLVAVGTKVFLGKRRHVRHKVGGH